MRHTKLGNEYEGAMSDETKPSPAAQYSVRYKHLIQSQRIWLNRAKEHAVNDRGEKAIKALNECLEILRLLEGMPPNE